MRGLAKGAKRSGGRFSGGIDLLTRGQVVAIVKPGRELSTLTDWTLLSTYRSLRLRLDANQTAYYLIDLCQRLLADTDPHPRLYDGLTAALEAIESHSDAAVIQLAFQWLALDEAGYRPALHDPRQPDAPLPSTVQFSPQAGGLSGDGGWKVRRPTVELLRAVQKIAEPVSDHSSAVKAYAEVEETLSTMGPDVLTRANRLLASYLRHVLGLFPETMRAIFADL